MNPGKRSSGAPTVRDRLGDWRQLLDRCGQKATRKQVHALRVVTLRLLAELEIDLTAIPRASHEAQAIVEFNRQGEKLRKVLGPVRELDVWIGKLQKLRKSLAESGEYIPRSTRECIRQVERLESRLKARRRQLEKKLMAAIRKRKDDFANASEGIGSLIEGNTTDDGANAANVVHGRFVEIARSFPALDEENLHEFRKRIKLVRYLAEIHQSDRACVQIAAQLKKLQSAIGEWHDWQSLAREAQGGRSRRNTAAELLAAIAAESLESALTTCYTITHKLIANHTLASGTALGRKAPQRVEADQREAADRQLA